MILIVSEPLDLHASHVAKKLQERGAALAVFDPARFPREGALSLTFSPMGSYQPRLRAGRGDIDLSQVSTVWYRRPQKPIAHDDVLDRAAREFVELECHMIIQDLWHSLSCEWLPAAPFVVQQAERKITQLKLASSLGLEVPPTLVTNDPEDLLEFYRQHSGHIVSKQAAKAFITILGTSFIRYTEPVTAQDIHHAADVAYCPMIFQAYVPKRVEVRITVVGRQAFAAEIHSQVTNHTRHDWRRYDHGRTPHFRHALPGEIEARCIRLCECLGLRYGAIDMVLTPDGRYVFLEINPNGQYLWIEQETGSPISDAICDLLMNPARTP